MTMESVLPPSHLIPILLLLPSVFPNIRAFSNELALHQVAKVLELQLQHQLWGCRIAWCILTSRYLVSLLPVSIIHVSDIFLVGFWSWEISFIMWGCRGWGWQTAETWVLVSVKWWDSPPPLGDLEPANQYAPSKSPRESWKARGRLSLNKGPRRLYQ